jgi:hypothetical protein
MAASWCSAAAGSGGGRLCHSRTYIRRRFPERSRRRTSGPGGSIPARADTDGDGNAGAVTVTNSGTHADSDAYPCTDARAVTGADTGTTATIAYAATGADSDSNAGAHASARRCHGPRDHHRIVAQRS